MSFQQEAVQQWAYMAGINRQTQQWILSDYDTWEHNPHYVGPNQGHPEEGDPLCAVYLSFKDASAAAANYAYGLNKALKIERYAEKCWVVWF